MGYQYSGPKVDHNLPFRDKLTRLMAVTLLAVLTSGSSYSKEMVWQDSTIEFNATTGAKPIKLVSFDATLMNKKVALSWTTAREKDASHFSVQRSKDGVEFTDAAIIFTDGNYETSRFYAFKDLVDTSAKGFLFYRLKMVDIDGKYEYSAIRMIKLGAKDRNPELQTSPNPVVNELRITIPVGWRQKPVVYELYSADGQLVKRISSRSATKTEIISMEIYQPGSYLVKAVNDQEVAVKQIIKRR